MEKDFNEIVQGILDRLSELYNFSDVEFAEEQDRKMNEDGRVNISLANSSLFKIFNDTRNLLGEGKPEQALISIYDYFGDIAEDIGRITTADMRSGKIKEKLKLIEILDYIVQEYDFWKETYYEKSLDEINQHPFFQEEKLTSEEVDPGYRYLYKIFK